MRMKGITGNRCFEKMRWEEKSVARTDSVACSKRQEILLGVELPGVCR